MLPQKYRLPAYDVSLVMRNGRRVTLGGMTVVIVSSERPNDQNNRFAFLVSTKVSKQAVVRNRVRRLLRESVHHLLPSIASTIDCVVIAHPNLVGRAQHEVEFKLYEILHS